MPDIEDELLEILGPGNVDVGPAVHDEFSHDEALGAVPVRPRAVVRPQMTADVVAIVKAAGASRTPLTARGSGTGLSGGCIPAEGGVVVSFERMQRILEIDTANHVAVVEPGVTLAELDAALQPHGLFYPVYPGELSASLGGNVATNAGGMRAVKYGVTRHHVLGVEAVLGTGEVITSGGKFVKSTSGYDLTQLLIGSEGTLGLVTRAILRLHPRPAFHATLLAPFASLDEIAAAVPPVVASGVGPVVVEYIDAISMAGITARADLDLGVPEAIARETAAYLVIVLENFLSPRLDEDAEALAQTVSDLGALDVYVLPDQSGARLIAARERAFWASKENGADDIVDVVVPRASIPDLLSKVGDLASGSSSLVLGCGHAGDGNVHLSVWQPDQSTRERLMHDIMAVGVGLGGAVSGEHGIGRQKRPYLADLEDPVVLDLMNRIKSVFDPHRILNPGVLLDAELVSTASR